MGFRFIVREYVVLAFCTLFPNDVQTAISNRSPQAESSELSRFSSL